MTPPGGDCRLPGGERVRIGVIGLGLIGQVAHVPNLVRLSALFTVTHICDLSASVLEAVAASVPGSPRCSTEPAHLIDDPDVDAVLLLTPGAHGPLAEAALRSGKHVLSEKPLCVSQAEAVRLAELATDRRLTLQVGYMKAYDPSLAAARAALDRIGDVVLVSVEVRHPTHESQIARLDYHTASDADVASLRRAEEGEIEESIVAIGSMPSGIDHLYRGVLLGSVIHELSALRALGFAPPTRWQHVMAVPFDPEDGAADPPSIAATARLAGDALLRLQWLWLPHYPQYEESITIVGTAGALHLQMPQPYGPNVPARLWVRTADGEVVVDDGRQRRDFGLPRRAAGLPFGDHARELGTHGCRGRTGGHRIAPGLGRRGRRLPRHRGRRGGSLGCRRVAAMTLRGIGSAPVSFGVYGDARPRGISPLTLLDAAVETGYRGMELGPPGFFGSPAEVADAFADRGLTIVGGYVPVHFSAEEGTLAHDLESMTGTLQELISRGSTHGLAILADEGSPELLLHPARSRDERRYALDDAGWHRLLRGLDRAMELAAKAGVRTSFHPHISTYVETPWEVDRLLSSTDIDLTLDTGHAWLAGADPVDVLVRFGDRVNHVHLKDVRREVLERAKAEGRDDFDTWWADVATPLGDGNIDIEGFLAGLHRRGYDGWLVIEQDRLPVTTDAIGRVTAEQAMNRALVEEAWARLDTPGQP